MFSQIASVFSSQGVVYQTTGYIGFPTGHRDAAAARNPGSEGKPFGPVFDQASAKLELSHRALKAAEEAGKQKEAAKEAEVDEAGEETRETDGSQAGSSASVELTPEERKVVEKLAERDREVHRHEQAHLASAGGNARGGAQYEYRMGPDGKSYAVSGHVDIDVSPVSGNPQATLQKAMAAQRAAMAPAEPSGADQAVAAAAAGMAREAARELSGKRAEKTEEPGAGSAARRNPYANASSGIGGRVNAYA